MTFEPTSEPSPDLPSDHLPTNDDLSSDPVMSSFGAPAADDIATDDAATPFGASNPVREPSAFTPPPPDDAADSDMPLSPADAARDSARGGRWAMSEWYDGWVYLGADGRPVVFNDGSRVGFRFADAARLAQDLTAAPEQETADGSNRRALAPLDSRFNKDWDPQRPKSTLADMTKWTRLLAYHLVQTTEPEEAVRRAVSMIFGNPVTMDERGEKLWVPTKYDAEAMRSLAGTLLRQAVGAEQSEGAGRNLGTPAAASGSAPSPMTRTIRGVPRDPRGLNVNLVKANVLADQTYSAAGGAQMAQAGSPESHVQQAQASSSQKRPAAAGGAFGRPARKATDSPYVTIIESIVPHPPANRSPEIAQRLARNHLTQAWPGQLAREFETLGKPNDGYGTYQLDPKKKGMESEPEQYALGKYQMRAPALIEIGLMTKDGRATGKYGVHTWEDFLNNPDAQEAAMIEWAEALEGYMKKHNISARLGKTITGIKEDITITEGGLIAAMHKQGAKGTLRYLEWLEKHGWNSRDHQHAMPTNLKAGFLAIETRLRRFQNTTYRQ